MKQSVAQTKRNRTGSPCSVDGPTAHARGGWQRYRRRQTMPTDDDDRRQPAKQYWHIRRASNKIIISFCRTQTSGENILVDESGAKSQLRQTDDVAMSEEITVDAVLFALTALSSIIGRARRQLDHVISQTTALHRL